MIPHGGVRFWYVGGGLRAYPVDSVQRGFYVGLKGAYLEMVDLFVEETDQSFDEEDKAFAAGLTVGYKWVTRGGLVVDAGIGPHALIFEDRDSIFYPWGDFGIGIAF